MGELALEGSDHQTSDRTKGFALLVDGYVRDLFTTGMVLQRLDYDVHIATQAEDAVTIIDAALPVLVITELSLPQMSGLELLVRLKHDPKTRAIPCIIHTALEDPNRENLCHASGCNAFLKKPVEPGDLYSVIQQVTEATPRQHIRLRTLLPVRVGGSSGGTGMEYISLLSENGIFVRTLTPRPINAVLPVTIIIHSMPIKLKAVVLYTVSLKPGLFKEPGMGMKFVDIANTDLELLRNFIKGQVLRDIPVQ